MRRFSQRNSLVTLSEINITPLLDLAFVLLIIFIITRPLLEQHVDLQLPQNKGSAESRDLDPRNIRLIEITARGEYLYQGRPVSLRQLEYDLVTTYQQNPKLIVDIRADRRMPWDYGVAVIDMCERNHITRFSIMSSPTQRP